MDAGGFSHYIIYRPNIASKSFPSAEESDCLTEYEEDGMDTVREEEGQEEEEDAEDPEDQSPGEWGPNGIFQTVSTNFHVLFQKMSRWT